MHRRQLLGSLAGVAGGLAGCLGGVGPSPESDTSIEDVTGADGEPSDICSRDPRPGRIPAIVEPAFAPDWSELGSDLHDDEPVVGLERAGSARAYPVSVLRLEVVNDRFEEPVLVTFCPLCSSGLTAVRRVDGRPTVFGNTSFTWRPPASAGATAIERERVFGVSQRGDARPTNDPNLVMFDEATGSYWSQLLAQAICGPRTGEELALVPSTVTTWGRWREARPGTTVLLPPPHSRTMTG